MRLLTVVNLNLNVSTHFMLLFVFCSEQQGETKILKLKNLRPKDYANYSCIASVRNVCGIADRRVVFKLTNKTGLILCWEQESQRQ